MLQEEKKKLMPATELKETAILLAAKNGVSEIVEKILENFPAAIHDTDGERKNILLLAAENRRFHVYKLLIDKKHTYNIPRSLLMQKVDNEWNTALHLAAKREICDNDNNNYPWPVPGAALQMQWEAKWYEVIYSKSLKH